MVTGLGVPSGLAPAGELPGIDRGFAIHTQAFDTAIARLSVLFVDIVENRVGFWKFFWASLSPRGPTDNPSG
jgi:hypothetical protein